MGYRYRITIAAGIILGLILLTSGIGKIIGHSSFFISISSLDFFPDIVQTLIVDWLPWGEVVLGLLLITGTITQTTALLSCVLVAGFIFQNTWMILNGYSNEPCSCFGVLDRIFQGKLSTMNSLYIDIGMLALAVLIYFLFSGGFKEWRPWFMRLPARPASPATLP